MNEKDTSHFDVSSKRKYDRGEDEGDGGSGEAPTNKKLKDDIIDDPTWKSCLKCSDIYDSAIRYLNEMNEDIFLNMDVIKLINTFNDYIAKFVGGTMLCITRPPQWGKSIIARLLYSYYVSMFNVDDAKHTCRRIPKEFYQGSCALDTNLNGIKRFSSAKTVLDENLDSMIGGSCICMYLDFDNVVFTNPRNYNFALMTMCHEALLPLEHFLENYLPVKNCLSLECNHRDPEDHLKILQLALAYLSEQFERVAYRLILIVDDFDGIFIQAKCYYSEELYNTLRIQMKRFCKFCVSIGVVVIGFGIFPMLYRECFAKVDIYDIDKEKFRFAFGSCVASDELDNKIVELASGFNYKGTYEFHPYCLQLALKAQCDLYENYFIHNWFRFMWKYIEDVATTKICLKFLGSLFHEVPRNVTFNFNTWRPEFIFHLLYHGGFIVRKQKEEFPSWYFQWVDKENLKDQAIYYIFPNVMMRKSFTDFLYCIIRNTLKTGAKYTVEENKELKEFLEGNEDKIINRLCSTNFIIEIVRNEGHYKGMLFYHYFVTLSQKYYVQREKQAGDGVLDLILIPKNLQDFIYIFEMKYVKNKDIPHDAEKIEQKLQIESLKAIHQLWNKKYHRRYSNNDELRKVFYIGVTVCSKGIYGVITPLSRVKFSKCACRLRSDSTKEKENECFETFWKFIDAKKKYTPA